MLYRLYKLIWLFAAVIVLAGCDRADPSLSLEGLNKSYQAALAASAAATTVYVADSQAEVATLGRLQDYFRNMSEASVSLKTRDVYAAQAYLNDNVVGITGVENIEAYFSHAASQAQILDVVFLDVARSATDYYIRWSMTVQAPALNQGEPVLSFGATQFRFDRDGKVILHRDFWDAATGLYEQLPYVGGMVVFVHEKLAGPTVNKGLEKD